MHFKGKMIVGALLIVIVMLLSGISILDNGINSLNLHNRGIPVSHSVAVIPNTELQMVPVAASYGSLANDAQTPYSGNISVMVTFSFQNQSRLSTFLSNLSDPYGSQFHKYLTRSQFASEFSISPVKYSQAVNYFEQFTGINVKQYADRVSLEIQGPASVIGDAFNTSIATVTGNTHTYYASSAPQMPLYIASHVSQVTGLSNTKLTISHQLFRPGPVSVPKVKTMVDGGFPNPGASGGVQYIYGSDLQVAYDEQTLLNITYPTKEVIATILWAGANVSGNPVGPFVPSDIYSYFNATLPSYESHSKVYGVPLNGAHKPGISASYDVTGANQENTLDLEMVGSTAPGSSIYNVYGPNSTAESTDSALAFILNPNSTYSALNNVSVISNSWGTSEYNNTVWYQYLQEAQARGISVLASSGDSGDNNQSSKYIPNPYYPGDYVQFPAAMAYNDFGVTSVGGTTLTLTNNLHILNQTAWYESNLSTSGSPAGSTGGISQVFKETTWQHNSEANNVLQGKGVGVPDIAAIGNNTIIYYSINGTEYSAPIAGTSVASPVEAGIVAEMDAILNHYNQSNLGYLNPLIYNLANKQITNPVTTSTLGFSPTGNYNSSLPTLPFYNVMYGRNHVYNATYGYNLVTGWGSIDAYNLTMYVLNINRSQSQTDLKGVSDKLSLNGLNVTSYLYNPSTSSYNTVNTLYNASIQQNLFLANQFGAPIYWIQNVVFISGSQSLGWSVNYTGWVVYPFFGQYPSQTVYQYNFPLGKLISMPHQFNVSTWISNLSEPMHQTVNFQVNSHVISLPVPGAAYIIDSHNYSYIWQGRSYYNGPYPDNPYSGGLNPQFGLIGGPSGGLGVFSNPTSGTISAFVEPMDLNSYVPAVSKVFNLSVDETGEDAEFLNFSPVNTSTWSLSVNNSSLSQGILDYTPTQYKQIFSVQGISSGTTWYVNLSNGQNFSSASNSLFFFEPNGTYSYTISTANKTYSPSPSSGSFTVNGGTVSETITFSVVNYTVKFSEAGLSIGTTWYVNLTDGMKSGTITATTYSFSLSNGTYSYTISTANKTYSPSPSSGSFTVNGGTVSKSVTFSLVKYTVTFNESGLPSVTTWYVNISNGIDSGAITGTSFSFSLSNGTYSYTISTANKTYSPSPSSGSFTANGAPVSSEISFSKYLYTATFSEKGLASGVSWYVNSTSAFGHATSPNNITFRLSNGTYAFTVTNLSSYYVSTTHITVSISGRNTHNTADYLHWGYITGTISPNNATLTINGKPVSVSTSGTFNLSVSNGTYDIVASDTGYYSYNHNITLNSGNMKNLTINLRPVSKPTSLSPVLLYGILGTVVVVAIAGTAVFLLRRR